MPTGASAGSSMIQSSSRSDTQFVLCAEHAQRLHAADFRTFDFKLLVAAVGIEHRTDLCTEDLRIPARQLGAPQTICSGSTAPTSTVVRWRWSESGWSVHDLADDDALKAAFHGLDLLETLDLETDVGQHFGHFLGREISVDITFEPVI